MPDDLTPRFCGGCGTELAPGLLSCPACHRLVHAERLKQLVADAERLESQGDASGALVLWRQALELLPPGSRQSQTLGARVAELSQRVERNAPVVGGPAPGSRWARWLAPLGAAGLLLWKLKFVLVFALTKLKLLFLGLTKTSTIFSMFLSFGVYWTAWGWRFALGFVAAMYVHEMGHVAALRALGIRASAPMFIPGLGAFVRMDQYPQSPREDARVGLAGPLWGLGATLALYLVHLAHGGALWAALAHVSALLNLFNLLPVWQLDGGRGFRALSRRQRFVVAGALVAAWMLTGEFLLVLLAVAAGVRAYGGQAPAEGDQRTLWEWLLLIVGLAPLCTVGVAGV